MVLVWIRQGLYGSMANVVSPASLSTCTFLMLRVWFDEAPSLLGFAMACEGNWSVNVTCLPFLSVVSWTFLLTKS